GGPDVTTRHAVMIGAVKSESTRSRPVAAAIDPDVLVSLDVPVRLFAVADRDAVRQAVAVDVFHPEADEAAGDRSAAEHDGRDAVPAVSVVEEDAERCPGRIELSRTKRIDTDDVRQVIAVDVGHGSFREIDVA